MWNPGVERTMFYKKKTLLKNVIKKSVLGVPLYHLYLGTLRLGRTTENY